MAYGEPGSIFLAARFRQVRLIARMGWRSRVPSALERRAQAERLELRSHLTQRQHRAAAAFRWELARQQAESGAMDDGPGRG